MVRGLCAKPEAQQSGYQRAIETSRTPGLLTKSAVCRVDRTTAFWYNSKRDGESSNGRTADSGSAYRGSNPWGAAKKQFPVSRFPKRRFWLLAIGS